MDDIWHVMFYFLVYSFIGWLWETVYCSLREKKFVYRGFLSGPYCPIYGFGALILLGLLLPLKSNLAILFLASTLTMSALEYGVSFALEKIFHQRWWDYSNEKFNINGRVALKPSLFWGIVSVIAVYFVHPAVGSMGDFVISINYLIPLVAVLVVFADAVHTIMRLVDFTKLLNQIRDYAENDPGSISNRVHERVESLRKSGQLRFTEKRLLRAFPRAFDARLPDYDKIRLDLLAIKKSKKSK